MLRYKVIEVFTSEESRGQGKPLSESVVRLISGLKIAARCIVTRGIGGCYENGEIAARTLEVLSYNMPVCICIILPACDLDRALREIEPMVEDGIVAVRDLDVVSHKARSRLIPRQIRVREVMTPQPQAVAPSTPLSEVVRLLLTSVFTGLPVMDDKGCPVGVISQGDLIYRAGMPLRLCLLAASDQERLDDFLQSTASRSAAEIMTAPAVCIREEKPLTDAVELMLEKSLKRLPVVDADGKLTGMLSRMDIFQTISRESPDWRAFRAQSIQVENLRSASDIMRRDAHTVRPDTPIDEVIRIIDSNDIQRVAVVDDQGRYLGLVSDESLLAAFAEHRAGLWDFIVSKMSLTGRSRKHKEFLDRIKGGTALDVMSAKHAVILEDSPIEEAIRIITENNLKRLPVLDAQGLYKGMVSRESLLRVAFAQCHV